MTQQQDRPRIYSVITRSRFLHIEDALTPISPDKPGKLRFFIGSYKRGSGLPAETAYHFLNDADARPLFLDMSWGRQVDIKDYKGSANGADGPVSRVLKIKGPKDGKVWFQVDNGPGQVIGQGAVKPAGEPTASISIALTTWEARKLALAVIEYMTAWRVAALSSPSPTPKVRGTQQTNKTPMASSSQPSMPKVEGGNATAAADAEALFGEEPAVGAGLAPAQAKAQEEPPADSPPAFFNLVNKALALGILDHDGVATRIKAPGSWRDKGVQLQAMLAA